MSDLTNSEKRKFEKLLVWPAGTCWIFPIELLLSSSPTAQAAIFTTRVTTTEAGQKRIACGVLQKEDNGVVGKLMKDMLDEIKPER